MFPVFMTIEMGTKYSIKELAYYTHIAGYGIPYDWYHGREPIFFRGAPVAPCRSSVFPRDTLTLTCVTPKDIGLSGEKTQAEIIEAAQARGLQLCPLEAVLQLRRQYGENQPYGENLVMPTVTGYSFHIAHDDSEYTGEAMIESAQSRQGRFHIRLAMDVTCWEDTSRWLFAQPRAI